MLVCSVVSPQNPLTLSLQSCGDQSRLKIPFTPFALPPPSFVYFTFTFPPSASFKPSPSPCFQCFVTSPHPHSLLTSAPAGSSRRTGGTGEEKEEKEEEEEEKVPGWS